MKIIKRKVKISITPVDPINDVESLLEKVLNKREYIAIKCLNTPDDRYSGSYEINSPYYRKESPEEWLVWKDLDS